MTLDDAKIRFDEIGIALFGMMSESLKTSEALEDAVNFTGAQWIAVGAALAHYHPEYASVLLRALEEEIDLKGVADVIVKEKPIVDTEIGQ